MQKNSIEMTERQERKRSQKRVESLVRPRDLPRKHWFKPSDHWAFLYSWLSACDVREGLGSVTCIISLARGGGSSYRWVDSALDVVRWGWWVGGYYPAAISFRVYGISSYSSSFFFENILVKWRLGFCSLPLSSPHFLMITFCWTKDKL